VLSSVCFGCLEGTIYRSECLLGARNDVLPCKHCPSKRVQTRSLAPVHLVVLARKPSPRKQYCLGPQATQIQGSDPCLTAGDAYGAHQANHIAQRSN